jgi:hypothetical protein
VLCGYLNRNNQTKNVWNLDKARACPLHIKYYCLFY